MTDTITLTAPDEPISVEFERAPMEATVEVIVIEGPRGPRGAPGLFGEPDVPNLSIIFEDWLT